MKKFILSIVSITAMFCSTSFGQLKVNTDGTAQVHYGNWTGGLKVGYGTMPGNNFMSTLYPVSNWWGALGTSSNEFGFAYIDHIYYGVQTQTSDIRLKKNIQPMGSVLSKINSLKTYTYNYNISPEKLKNLPDQIKEEKTREKIGLMAQDVQKVFPQLVYQGDSGYLSLDYVGMVPILLEAIKEQQIQIEALKFQLDKTTKSDKAREEYVMQTTASHLVQNNPNPFTTSTEISYSAATTAKSVSIILFDMAGTLIKTYDNLATGEGSIIVDGGALNAGMYMYSLIVDGVELDNKRMILTK
jgi:hypothetical protein